MPLDVLPAHVQSLDEAIERRAPVVLWFRIDDQVHHSTSRFLGRQTSGIWIEMPPLETALIDRLIQRRDEIAVAYKSAEANHRFIALAVLHDQAAVTGHEPSQDGLLLQRQEDQPDAHRRRDFRVTTKGSTLSAKVWRIADHVYFRDRPHASQQLKVRLLDLSTSGVGMIIDAPAEPIAVGQRLRMEMTCDGTDELLDGVIRHISPRKKGQNLRIGVEFKKLENDVIWRQSISALTKIIGDIQRAEVRRARDAADAATLAT